MLSTLATNKTADVLAASPGRPRPAEQLFALVEGFNVAFVSAAVLVAVSAVVLLVAVRKQDMPRDRRSDAAPVPAA